MNIQNLIKKTSLYLATFALTACPLNGMDKQPNTSSTPLFSAKNLIYGTLTVAGLYALTKPSVRKHITLKNSVLAFSAGVFCATLYGINSLHNCYQNSPNLKTVVNIGLEFFKDYYFKKSEEPKAPTTEDLKQELYQLIDKVQKETKRTDFEKSVFVEILKKDDEFKQIYEDLEKKKLSPEKLDAHLKTVRDYQTTYFTILVEHITPKLPAAKYIPSSELDKRDDKDKLIRKNNLELKEIAKNFLVNVFAADEMYNKIKNSFGDNYYDVNTLETLITTIIADLKPFEKDEFPFARLCKKLKYDDVTKQNSQLCARYNRKIAFNKIQQTITKIETALKFSIQNDDHKIALDILALYLKDAYGITKKTKDFKLLLKALDTLMNIKTENVIKKVKKFIKLSKNTEVNFIKKHDKDFKFKKYSIDPIGGPRELLTNYCFDDQKNNPLFAGYLNLRNAFEENAFLYNLCWEYKFNVDKTNENERKFYNETIQKKIQNGEKIAKNNFIKNLETAMITQATKLKAATTRMMPIFEKNGASYELMQFVIQPYLTLNENSLKKDFEF